jgi:hypothetical protein
VPAGAAGQPSGSAVPCGQFAPLEEPLEPLEEPPEEPPAEPQDEPPDELLEPPDEPLDVLLEPPDEPLELPDEPPDELPEAPEEPPLEEPLVELSGEPPSEELSEAPPPPHPPPAASSRTTAQPPMAHHSVLPILCIFVPPGRSQRNHRVEQLPYRCTRRAAVHAEVVGNHIRPRQNQESEAGSRRSHFAGVSLRRFVASAVLAMKEFDPNGIAMIPLRLRSRSEIGRRHHRAEAP